MAHEDMNIFSNKYQIWNPNHLVTIKNHLLLIDIGCACSLTHLAACDYFFVNKKTQIFLPVRGNLFVECNLTYLRYNAAFNGVKWVVLDMAWTL